MCVVRKDSWLQAIKVVNLCSWVFFFSGLCYQCSIIFGVYWFKSFECVASGERKLEKKYVIKVTAVCETDTDIGGFAEVYKFNATNTWFNGLNFYIH